MADSSDSDENLSISQIREKMISSIKDQQRLSAEKAEKMLEDDSDFTPSEESDSESEQSDQSDHSDQSIDQGKKLLPFSAFFPKAR